MNILAYTRIKVKRATEIFGRSPELVTKSVFIAIIVATSATRSAASNLNGVELAVSSAYVMLARAYVAFNLFVTFEHEFRPPDYIIAVRTIFILRLFFGCDFLRLPSFYSFLL